MTTTTQARLDRWQQIWTSDGIEVWGTERNGWHIRDIGGNELARVTQPGMDVLGALDWYRRQLFDAERLKAE